MQVRVRPVRAADAPAIHDIQLSAQVLPYILPLPSLRLEQVERRLQETDEGMHMFVAEADERTAGYIGMRRGRNRLSHAGQVFLAVHPDLHGQGIGTALLKTVIDLADNWLMLERLELTVLDTNVRAQALYERLGFVVEGRKRGSVVSEGRFADEIVMGRLRPGGRIAPSSEH